MSQFSTIGGLTVKSAVAYAISEQMKVIDPETENYVYPTIYREKVRADAELPCYFIWDIETLHAKQMRQEYTRTYMMEIRHHYPADEIDVYEKQSHIANELTLALSSIEVPNYAGVLLPVHGRNMAYKITDNVLVFLVDYEIRMKRFEVPGNPMGQLDLNQTENI